LGASTHYIIGKNKNIFQLHSIYVRKFLVIPCPIGCVFDHNFVNLSIINIEMMKIGDKVSAVDDAVNGVVTEIDGDLITINTEDDFELQYSEKELVVIGGFALEKEINFFQISQAISEKEDNKPKKSQKVKSKERNLPPMEVDLHINQLIKNSKSMSNYDMVTLQLDTAKRQLDFAISKRIQKIVFIHGVGEGVLRAELEFLFKRYDALKFYDADFQKYGRGAVEVYIFQNKKN